MANRGGKKKLNVIRIVLIVLVILAGIIVFVLNMSKPEEEVDPDFDITIQTEAGEKSDELDTLENESKAEYPVSELESLDVDVFKDKDWVHYLLIGLDNRKDTFEGGRSDALMIFSVNDKEGRIVLSSMPRDTLVYINGKGYDKVTHTYAYGRAKLLVETIERNFDIDIKHYFTINFAGMEKVVDALGGLEMELTQKESDHMLSFFEVGGTKAGMNTLTGKQALTYCRIRKIDTDFARTERQYKVLMKIYEKVKVMSPIKYPSLITAMYDYFYTDCSVAECIDIAQALMELGADSIENVMLVDENCGTGRKINGAYVYVVNDLEETMKEWRTYMGVIGYTPSEGMVEISNHLKNNY
ncbi:MAG: LCP family protein [Lachnospiraceae bacterium]|nr:LCP family protein [Lachnospiraceae bacterium]